MDVPLARGGVTILITLIGVTPGSAHSWQAQPASDGPAEAGQTHTVNVAGTVTRYQVLGNPRANTTIIGVHGFRGDHHGLLPIAEQLSAFRFIACDLPGFGSSEPFQDRLHNVSSYADWLAGFVDAVVPAAPPVVIGHSFGSVVAASAAAGGMPVERLVLINPIATSAVSGPHPLLARLAQVYYGLGATLPRAVGSRLLSQRGIVRFISELTVKTSDRELRAWIHDQHRRYFSAFADRRVVVEAFASSISDHVAQYASELDVPTLLLGADSDELTPVRQQERLVRLIPEARLLVLAGVGHLIHYERPQAAAAAITQFLNH